MINIIFISCVDYSPNLKRIRPEGDTDDWSNELRNFGAVYARNFGAVEDLKIKSLEPMQNIILPALKLI